MLVRKECDHYECIGVKICREMCSLLLCYMILYTIFIESKEDMFQALCNKFNLNYLNNRKMNNRLLGIGGFSKNLF